MGVVGCCGWVDPVDVLVELLDGVSGASAGGAQGDVSLPPDREGEGLLLLLAVLVMIDMLVLIFWGEPLVERLYFLDVLTDHLSRGGVGPLGGRRRWGWRWYMVVEVVNAGGGEVFLAAATVEEDRGEAVGEGGEVLVPLGGGSGGGDFKPGIFLGDGAGTGGVTLGEE